MIDPHRRKSLRGRRGRHVALGTDLLLDLHDLPGAGNSICLQAEEIARRLVAADPEIGDRPVEAAIAYHTFVLIESYIAQLSTLRDAHSAIREGLQFTVEHNLDSIIDFARSNADIRKHRAGEQTQEVN